MALGDSQPSTPINIQRLLGSDRGEWTIADYVLPVIALVSTIVAIFAVSSLPMSARFD